MKKLVGLMFLFFQFLSCNQLYDSNQINSCFEIIKKDSNAVNFFKIDGIYDNPKVEVVAKSECPKSDFILLPKVIWPYLIDTLFYDNYSSRAKKIYTEFYHEIDCNNYNSIKIDVNNVKFHDTNSNIILKHKLFNDSILYIELNYKVLKNESYSQYKMIYYYFIASKYQVKMIKNGLGS